MNNTELLIRLGYLINFFALDEDKDGLNKITRDVYGLYDITFTLDNFTGNELRFMYDPKENLIALDSAEIDGHELDGFLLNAVIMNVNWESNFTEICEKIYSMAETFEKEACKLS